jgi:hypothetical protein
MAFQGGHHRLLAEGWLAHIANDWRAGVDLVGYLGSQLLIAVNNDHPPTGGSVLASRGGPHSRGRAGDDSYLSPKVHSSLLLMYLSVMTYNAAWAGAPTRAGRGT